MSKLKEGIIRKQSNFRDVFGKRIDLFSGENVEYVGIPKLRSEKHFPKKPQDLKTDLRKNFGGQGVSSGEISENQEITSSESLENVASTSGINPVSQNPTLDENPNHQGTTSSGIPDNHATVLSENVQDRAITLAESSGDQESLSVENPEELFTSSEENASNQGTVSSENSGDQDCSLEEVFIDLQHILG